MKLVYATQKGFSTVAMAVAIALAGAGTATVGYYISADSKDSDDSVTNKSAAMTDKKINSLSSNSSDLIALQSVIQLHYADITNPDKEEMKNYDGLDTATAARFAGIPDKMKTASGKIKTEWAADGVQVKSHRSYQEDFFITRDWSHSAFSLLYRDVASDDCADLVLDNEESFFRITIDGEVVKERSVATNRYIDVDPHYVVNQCGIHGETRDIEFNSY